MAYAQLQIKTHYSQFGSIARIPELFERASEIGLNGLAITDFCEMGGVPEFLSVARKYPDIKPIIGCELPVKLRAEVESLVTLLAKNQVGYYNLVQLSSQYGTAAFSQNALAPSAIEKHKEGLICLIPVVEMEDDSAQWYIDTFGDDLYIYLDNELFAEDAIELGKEGIKTVLAEGVSFVRKEEALAFEVFQSSHIRMTIKDEYDPEELLDNYLKSEEEVRALYPDYPEFIDNTEEVLQKIERYDISSELAFPFVCEHPYEELRALVYIGAKQRYGVISEDLQKRIDFELDTIVSRFDVSSYFLIIKDMIDWARKNGIIVGPGRGSAVGSVVNYCLGITDIDPLKYGLLFERFLNPERIQLPDIDTDFDAKGLESVHKHLVEKYGKDKVSYVSCYHPLSASEAFQMAATVFGISSEEIAKIMEFIPWRSLKDELDNNRKLQRVYNASPSRVQNAYQIAMKLEGVFDKAGMHACANLVSARPLSDCLPMVMRPIKNHIGDEEDAILSQYDVHWVEDAGVLKIDTLGLLILDYFKETSALIKKRFGIDVNLNEIPLDDEATFEVYQYGDTEDVFQFDSDGMRQWLDRLRPDSFAQLVAMNALYRPGPMDLIPDYIARKNGIEHFSVIPGTEEILSETYGLIIYQEQVMMIVQNIAGFTPGQAAHLRKYIGSKRHIDKYLPYEEPFITGGVKNGFDKRTLESLWRQMEDNGCYAFNKSHAVAYTWLSYQTAWLKAHYREEYLDAVAIVERRFGR